MEMDAMLFWNIILTMVVVPFGWAFNKMFQEVKRIQILLNKTREDYARKDDVKDDMHNLCLLYTSPSPRDLSTSRMPSSA